MSRDKCVRCCTAKLLGSILDVCLFGRGGRTKTAASSFSLLGGWLGAFILPPPPHPYLNKLYRFQQPGGFKSKCFCVLYHWNVQPLYKGTYREGYILCRKKKYGRCLNDDTCIHTYMPDYRDGGVWLLHGVWLNWHLIIALRIWDYTPSIIKAYLSPNDNKFEGGTFIQPPPLWPLLYIRIHIIHIVWKKYS